MHSTLVSLKVCIFRTFVHKCYHPYIQCVAKGIVYPCKSTMMAPMFRALPWGVRSTPRPWFSQILEPKIQNLIISHRHYLVLPGFTAGTSDIRTCYFCLNLWSKKILSRYRRFLLWNQVKLSNASALLSNFGSLAPTFVKIKVRGYS